MGDDHKINLQNRCRYGNFLFKEADYPVPKNVHTKEFLHLGCDITKDLSEVHPSKVSNKLCALCIADPSQKLNKILNFVQPSIYLLFTNTIRIVWCVQHLKHLEGRENVYW